MSSRALLLKFWYTIGDVGGAGAYDSKGSERLHEQTARLFFEGIKKEIINPFCFKKILIWLKPMKAILYRSQSLPLGTSLSGLALARVASLSRLGAKSYVDYQMAILFLQESWQMLSPAQQQSLCFLLLSQTPGLSVLWGAAIGMNPQTIMKKQVRAQIDEPALSEAGKAFLKEGSPVENAVFKNALFSTLYILSRVADVIPETDYNVSKSKLVCYFVPALKERLIYLYQYDLFTELRSTGDALEVRLGKQVLESSSAPIKGAPERLSDEIEEIISYFPGGR